MVSLSNLILTIYGIPFFAAKLNAWFLQSFNKFITFCGFIFIYNDLLKKHMQDKNLCNIYYDL